MENRNPQKDKVAVIVAKGGSKGSRGRPAGVKGRYKVRHPYKPQHWALHAAG